MNKTDRTSETDGAFGGVPLKDVVFCGAVYVLEGYRVSWGADGEPVDTAVFGQVIGARYDDGACLIFEELDKDGDVMSDRLHTCGAYQLRLATREEYVARYGEGVCDFDDFSGVTNADLQDARFVYLFESLAQQAHETARSKGWYDKRDELLCLVQENGSGDVIQLARTALLGLSISLMHSELSEGLENARAGMVPDDKIPEFSGVEAELADVIIRIMDTAASEGLRVGEAVVAKMAMNRSREHKHGGKLA
jgi:hypothetical protein